MSWFLSERRSTLTQYLQGVCDGDGIAEDRDLTGVVTTVLGPDAPDVQVVLGGEFEARIRSHHDALGSEDVVRLLPD